MTRAFGLTIYILICTTSLAQPVPDTLWTRCFGGPEDDWPQDAICLSNDRYAVAGTWADSGMTGEYIGSGFLMLLHNNGDTLWTRKLQNASDIMAICELQDGGFALLGAAEIESNYCLCFCRTDSQGSVTWSRNYAFGEYGWGTDFFQTSAGDFILAGTIYSEDAGSFFHLLKTNSSGDTIWTRMWHALGDDRMLQIEQVSDSTFVVLGETHSVSGWDYFYYLAKWDTDGNLIWAHEYSGYPSAFQQTADGGFILVGGDIIRTNSNGDTLWTKLYGTGSDLWDFSDILCTGYGYVVTASYGGGTGFDGIFGTNLNGDTLWSKRYYAGVGSSGFGQIVRAHHGGYLLLGATEVPSGGPSGHQLDYLIVSTGSDQTNPIESSSQLWPQNFSFSNYPNPFNPSTTVRFSVPKTAHVSLGIYDILGRRVTTLTDGLYNTGLHELRWNCPECASGVYILQMNSEGFSEQRKMLLMK